MENEEKSTKVNGVSAQINLGVGSPIHTRFANLLLAAGLDPSKGRDFCNILMDAYENPGTDEKTAQDFNDLHETIKKRDEEIGSYQKALHDKETEIEDLNKKLEAAQSDANANAESGLGKQLQIDELHQRIDGAIILKPNPVVRYFLDEMAKKTETTPDKILEKLFIEDLQNPLANNLPYIVTSSEIRKVMREIKTQQQ